MSDFENFVKFIVIQFKINMVKYNTEIPAMTDQSAERFHMPKQNAAIAASNLGASRVPPVASGQTKNGIIKPGITATPTKFKC